MRAIGAAEQVQTAKERDALRARVAELEAENERVERARDAVGADRLRVETDLRAQLAVARAEVERLKSNAGLRLRQVERQVRRLGYEPRQLQARWRDLEQVAGMKHYEPTEALWAIIDALSHEGIPAWSGDATSCVEQIVAAWAHRAFEAEADVARLEGCNADLSALNDQRKADAQQLRELVERLVELHDVQWTRPERRAVSWSNSAATLQGVGQVWSAALAWLEAHR